MAQVINTNTMSLVTRNNLNKSQGVLGTAIERLSSGLRINTAKDDAAGQAIANRFSAQIRGLTQASRNANDGISIAQTAEGALSEINTNVQRIRELTVQALNDTNSDSDKKSIQNEIDQRLAEVNRISEQTDFNGTKVLQGGKDASGAPTNILSLKIQVGANDGENIEITIAKIDKTTLNLENLKVTDLVAPDIASGETAPTGIDSVEVQKFALDAIDKALSKIDAARGELGALQNRFESTVNNLNNTSNNLSAARSRIEDADYAEEVSNMTRGQILQQAGTSVLAQANQVPQSVLSLLQ